MPIKENDKQGYQDGASIDVSAFLELENSSLEHEVIGKEIDSTQDSKTLTQVVISRYLNSKKQNNPLINQRKDSFLENSKCTRDSSALKL